MEDSLPKGRNAAWFVCAVLAILSVRLLVDGEYVLAIVAAFGTSIAGRIASMWDTNFATTLANMRADRLLKGRYTAYVVSFLMMGLGYILLKNDYIDLGFLLLMASMFGVYIAAKWNTNVATVRMIKRFFNRQ